jgi:hypothetical protein
LTPIEIGKHKVQCEEPCAFTYKPLDGTEPDVQIKDLLSGGGQQISLKGMP